MSFTCFDSFEWAIGAENTDKMNEHYQLWSKAGKTPNSNVLDPKNYLINFNWIPNWIDLYFFNKVSDFLLGLFAVNLIVFIFFFKRNKTKFIFDKKIRNILILYLFIFILFAEWFINHPALRYGGFTLIALSIFIPLSIFLESRLNINDKLKKKVTFLIFTSFIIFSLKNIDRIFNEFDKYNFNPLINAHYFISDTSDHFNELLSKAEKKRNVDRKKFYIVLDQNLIKKIQLDK